MISRIMVLLMMFGVSCFAQPKPATPAAGSTVPDLSQFQPTDKEMLAEAASFIKQKNPGRAVMIFSDLLRFYPDTTYREEVLYRVAACYKDMGRFDEVRQTLDLLDKNYPQGTWQPSAGLLRGEMLAAEKKWDDALPYLQKAAAAILPDTKLRANYLVALACDNLGKPAEAKAALDFLVKQTNDNPYLDYARVRLATVEIATAQADHGMTLLKSVLASSNDPNLRSEAGVRAGNLSYSRRNYQEAVGFYEVVRRTEAPDFWKKLANLGLVQANFAEKNYTAALQVYNETKPNFPDSMRPQVLFLVAESYRLTKQNAQALEMYQFVLEQFPDDINAEPSSWARILLLKDTAGAGQPDEDFLAETTRFIAKFPNSARLPLVQAMRADAFYAKGDFKTAAPMYGAVLQSPEKLKLGEDALSGVYFRAGYAFFNLKDYKMAVLWLTNYLAKFKNGALTPNVLWLKGQAELELKEENEALLSWGQLIDRYPQFSQREPVLWQAALLAGSKKDYAKMGVWLDKLVAEFPQTTHLAEARYWLAISREAANDDNGALAQWIAARKLGAARYYAVATQRVIRILLKKQDAMQLRAEVDWYDQWRLKNPQDPAISLDVYEWLGQQLMGGDKPADAENYLRRVLAGSKNNEQRKRTQLRLAALMSKLKNWPSAVKDWTAYRANFPEETNRSAVLEPLAQAYVGVENYALAQKLAEQILQQNPEGEYNARGRILLGDIAFAKKQYMDAAKLYSAVALLIDDTLLTPQALSKANKAWHLAGNEAKADEALLQLKKKYPDYK